MKGTRAVATTTVDSAEAERNLAAASDRLAALEAANAALTRQLTQIQAASTQNVDAADAQAPPRASRHRLPGERASVTHKFAIAGHEGYITVGLYPNGYPGEIFIRMAKEGSTVSGLMDSFATAISISLQHGVPLKVLCEKFAHTRFEPSGWTGNPEIGFAKSIMDYIFRWIQMRFLSGTQLDLFAGLAPTASVPVEGTVTAPGNKVSLAVNTQITADPVDLRTPHQATPHAPLDSLSAAVDASPQAILQREARTHKAISDEDIFDNGAHSSYADRTPPRHGIASDPSADADSAAQTKNSMADRGIYHASDAMKSMYDMGDAPSCATCGAIMTRSGSCYRCMSCGSTSGCS
jgi:ribonucleoside-diphosphate reductase alpha chain